MPPLSHSWVTFWPGGRWRPRVSKTAPAFSSVCQFPQVIHKKLQPSRRSAPLVRFTQGAVHLVLPPPGWCRGILSHRSDPQGKLQPSAFFSHRRTKLWCGKYRLGWMCRVGPMDNRCYPSGPLGYPRFVCHPGVRRTITFLRQHFWWPSLNKDVRESVAICPACACNKSSTKHLRPTPPINHTNPGRMRMQRPAVSESLAS